MKEECLLRPSSAIQVNRCVIVEPAQKGRKQDDQIAVRVVEHRCISSIIIEAGSGARG